MYKVYVTDHDYPDLDIEKAILEPIGAEIIALDDPTGSTIAAQAYDADAFLQQYAVIDRSIIERLDNCKVIARYGIGVDIVDVEAATNSGIVVTNVPDYCIEEVADHSIAMALTLMRSIPKYNAATRDGRWHWSEWSHTIRRFRGTTFGLVGFGNIARNMTRKLAPFGFNIMAYDPYVSESIMATHGVTKGSLDQVLEHSDVLDIMAPWTPETHHLINSETLAKMKPGAILINCARGKIVDNRALYEALRAGRLAAAGLDDTEEEPAQLESWSPSQNPLFSLDNVIFTPHAAYISEDALKECRRIAAENVRSVLTGQNAINPVNL